MARKTRQDELFERLHAQGLRKRTAKLIADATGRGRKPASGVEKTIADLKRAVGEVEDRLTGGPGKRKAAAKKAAATRRRNAQARSEAAKKGARTRARSKTTR